MKKTLLVLLMMISLGSNAQWSYTVTDAWAYGCPGYICINGPLTGYSFQVFPPPIWGPNIPGSCGGAEFAVWAGAYSVSVIQNSTGNTVQSFSNVAVSQPPQCGLELLNPVITSGCYSNNDLSFVVGGLWCGGGSVYITKDNQFYTSFGFSNPQQYLSNLPWGEYVIQASDANCSDTMHVSIPNKCLKPDTGLSTTNITKTSAKLNWNTKVCAVGYSIQYKISGAATWITKKITSNTGYKFLGNLTPGTTYKWRVKTRCHENPDAGSGWSVVKSFTTLPPRLGEELTESLNIMAYPNPASSQLTVSCETIWNGSETFRLMDMSGRNYQLTTLGKDDENVVFDLAGIASGVYQLTVTTSHNTYNKRVIVVK